MKKNFIEYHGCNLLYKDGTRQIVKKHCFKPTLYPFWKLSNDVTNSVAKSTRAQLKSVKFRIVMRVILSNKLSNFLIIFLTDIFKVIFIRILLQIYYQKLKDYKGQTWVYFFLYYNNSFY